MTFYERYIELCQQKGIKPTSVQMQQVTGISSSALTQWKTLKSLPTAAILGNLAKYFEVSVEYLIGLSTLRSNTLSEQQQLLLEAYDAADQRGKNKIIQVCMNEQDKAEERRVKEEGPVSG